MNAYPDETTEAFPPQTQATQPGIEADMVPKPESAPLRKRGEGKLDGKVAVITGGDSGIGKAVALLYAEEGADLVIVYQNEHEDALQTESELKARGSEVLLLAGDLSKEAFSSHIVKETVARFGKIDILINNAAVQFPQDDFVKITPDQLERTFRINVFAAFYLTIAALPHMKEGSCIINSSSVTAFRGSPHLVDYAATKGALISMTRSLSGMLADRKIRVNAVAPGPIWTPLIPASFTESKVATFGQDVPMGRAGQPREAATAYLFLASDDASYFTGQTLHPNGGEIVNA